MWIIQAENGTASSLFSHQSKAQTATAIIRLWVTEYAISIQPGRISSGGLPL